MHGIGEWELIIADGMINPFIDDMKDTRVTVLGFLLEDHYNCKNWNKIMLVVINIDYFRCKEPDHLH